MCDNELETAAVVRACPRPPGSKEARAGGPAVVAGVRPPASARALTRRGTSRATASVRSRAVAPKRLRGRARSP